MSWDSGNVQGGWRSNTAAKDTDWPSNDAETGWNSGENGGSSEWKNEGGGDFGGGGFDDTSYEPPKADACRQCGKEGHIVRNCPEPRVCFNCREPGHNKDTCPNPRKPRGGCRVCSEEGHMSSDCPNKPPRPCFNCGQEGHSKSECTEERVFKGTCRHCGVEGHAGSQCPDKPKRPCYGCGEEGHNRSECPKATVPFEVKCRFCKQEGHRTHDCPDKPEEGFPCFNCGQHGHDTKDCPEPKVFTGTCRVCNEEGHPGSQCPKRICKNCNAEGHVASACTEPRNIHDVPDDHPIQTIEDSWNAMVEADKEGELEDFRQAMLAYSRALPNVTFRDLEEAFRLSVEHKFRVHLIAMESTLLGNKTLVNLQGVQNQKYIVKLQLGAKPKRTMMVMKFQSADKEENLQRLEQAGFIMDSFQLFCPRCHETGHVAKHCTKERVDREERRDETSIRDRPERDAAVATVVPTHWAVSF